MNLSPDRLTYSMVESPSWAANWFAVSQQIPRISRNPKVHYCTHKRTPPLSILGQPNLVHIPTSHLLEIRPNIIHPSTPRSPQWSPSIRFHPARPYTPPSPQPYASHAQPISFFSILLPAQYWVRSTNDGIHKIKNKNKKSLVYFTMLFQLNFVWRFDDLLNWAIVCLL